MKGKHGASAPNGSRSSSITAICRRRRTPAGRDLEIKGNIERQLLSRLNLEHWPPRHASRPRAKFKPLSLSLITESGADVSNDERDAIIGDVLDEVFGLGPLEPLLRDKTVNDVLVNTWKHVFVERKGKLERVPGAIQDDQHLMRVIDRIVSGVGRRVRNLADGDARPDGSRVNAIIPPLAVDRFVAFRPSASRPTILSTSRR